MQNGDVTLAARVYAASHLTGTFVLRSGRTADRYFDKYRFESDPALLAEIVAALAPLVPPGIEGLAGLELGGVPLATMLSSVTGLPAFFVRKQPKKYGTEQVCEGGDIAGRNLLIVEDVVTTGGQLVLSAQDLRSEGGIVRARPLRHRPPGGRGRRRRRGGHLAAGALHHVRARSRRLSGLGPRFRPADCGLGGGAASRPAGSRAATSAG